MAIEARQLFNFIQGSDITGESAYDVWKRLGNEGSEADFLEFIRSGPKGESAHIYSLAVSDPVMKKGANNALLPVNTTFTGFYRIGAEATKYDYAGRFIIEETMDGAIWKTKYTSAADEVSVTYTPSNSHVKVIKCTLYAAGGTTTAIDTQSCVILEDVAGLEVGARNLLSNSDRRYEINSESTEIIDTISIVDTFELQRFVGKFATLSFYAHSNSTYDNADDGAQLTSDRFGIIGKIVWSDSTRVNSETTVTAFDMDAVRVSACKQRLTSTYEVLPPAGYDTIESFTFDILLTLKPIHDNNIWVLERPKLELGNIATEWTIAPEDVENLVVVLQNDSHIVATDAYGNGGNFDGCETGVAVYYGVNDVTDKATFEIETNEELTGEWDSSNYKYTVTDLSADNGYVDITASYKSISVTKRFSISKSKAGKSAYQIWLEEGNVGTEDDFLYENGSEYTDDAIADEVIARNDAIALAKNQANAYTDSKVSAEATARGTAIESALTEAKEYTDTEVATAKTVVNGYTDSKVSAEATARNNAITAEVTARDNAISAAKDEVKEYTDDQIDAAKTAVNGYTDSKVSAEATIRGTAIESALTEAKEYAGTQDATNLATAKSYTDTKVSAEATARGTAIEGALTEAKEYTDTEISKAKTAVNGYTDTKVSGEVTARNNAIAAAKTEANAYTDTEIAEEVTARNNAIAAAKTDVNGYTDSKVSAEATARDNAISEAISAEVTARNSAIATAKSEAIAQAEAKVAEIIDGAPENMNTLSELGALIKENDSAIDAINQAITIRAKQEDLEAHTDDSTIHITSAERTKWNNAQTNAVTSANAYTDAEIDKAKTAANTYTDNKMSAEVTARNNAISTAKGEANAYTDEQILGHTHKYAGSSSVGGSANSAVKLDSSAGSTTQPIYFKDGKPTATSYELNKTVPADAKFTDTTYDAATTSKAGLMSADDKVKLDNSNIAFGACETAGDVVAKVVTLSGNEKWKLTVGSLITVKFTNTNTATAPTINVNGTGAYPIWYNNAEYTSASSYGGYANRYIIYQFNGTHWVFISWSYDTNSDTKVQQDAAITTNGEYPVILAYSTSTSKVTNTVNKTSTLKYNPSTKVLTAGSFKGALTGNADTATKATQDESGNVIISTYETKSDSRAKLTEAKNYANTQAENTLKSAKEYADSVAKVPEKLSEFENDLFYNKRNLLSTLTAEDFSDFDMMGYMILSSYKFNQKFDVSDFGYELSAIEQGTNELIVMTDAEMPFEKITDLELGLTAYMNDIVYILDGGYFDEQMQPVIDNITTHILIMVPNDYLTNVSFKLYGIDQKKIEYECLGDVVGKKYKDSDGNITTGEIFNYNRNEASGTYSHAEGWDTTASGGYSHAEGESTKASGANSHAEGLSTTASGKYSHVQGIYNLEDTNDTYAHIVGNGTYSKRSNAHTLDWKGNAEFAGDVVAYGCGGAEPISLLALNEKVNSGGGAGSGSFSATGIVLTDIENGYDYLLQMIGGNLTVTIGCASINVTTMPTKTSGYYEGGILDTTGMVVTAYCQDGTSTREIKNYTCSPIAADGTVIITYSEGSNVYTTFINVSVGNVKNALVDFNYTANSDGTYTITGWKGTLNGAASTEMIIPDSSLIIV